MFARKAISTLLPTAARGLHCSQQVLATKAVCTTSKGEFTVELYTEDLPITTGSFMSLARADLFVFLFFDQMKSARAKFVPSTHATNR
jgi:hypothetical protein